MKNRYLLVYLFGMLLVFSSCKNEGKETLSTPEIKQKTEKEPLTKEEKKQVNSVLTKAMVTPELKTFVSMVITTEHSDMLAKQDGPYTILAPSNEAFRSINEKRMKFLLNPVNKEVLVTLIKSHIVSGNIDSASLVQNIKSANGSYKIVSQSGATYQATLEGTDIVITDVQGTKAVIGKSDINGSNGVLHVLDAVLVAN